MTHDLRPLIDAYCCGAATDEQLEQLAALLRDDPGARRAFAEAMDLHAALRWRETSGGRVRDEPPASRPQTPATGTSSTSLRIPVFAAAAAAALLVAVSVAAYVLVINAQPGPPPQTGRPVATLIESTGTVVIDDGIANPGDDYRPGLYQIDAGSADFQLTSGASMRMRGRTRMRVEGDMSCELLAGTARFVCPASAQGYRVDLPGGASVVDLGTGFILHVDPAGVSSVRVTDGRVRLERVVNGPVELIAGQSGVIVDSRFYPAASPPADRSPIAVDVSPASGKGAFPAAADDLLQTMAGPAELSEGAAVNGVFGGQSIESLTNGPAVWHPQPGQTYESWSTLDGGAITWRFDAAAAPLGVDIDRLDVIAGCWPNRIGHKYTVEIATLDADEFAPLYDVDYPDDSAVSGGEFETRMRLTRASGEPLATGVTAIRFTFHDDNPHGQNLGQSVFREIDVIGRPTEIEIENENPQAATPADPEEGATP